MRSPPLPILTPWIIRFTRTRELARESWLPDRGVPPVRAIRRRRERNGAGRGTPDRHHGGAEAPQVPRLGRGGDAREVGGTVGVPQLRTVVVKESTRRRDTDPRV